MASGYQQDAKHLYQLLTDPRIALAIQVNEMYLEIMHLRMFENKSFRQIGLQLDIREDCASFYYKSTINRLKEVIIKTFEVFNPAADVFEENKKLREENAQLKERLCFVDSLEERPVDPAVLNLPIRSLGLCPRAFKLLTANGVHSVELLITYSFNELLNMKKMGHRSVWDIEYALKKLGLQLKTPL